MGIQYIYSDTSTTNILKIRGDIEIVGEYGSPNVKFINCTPTNADGYPYLVDFSSKGSGTGYLTENEVNSKLQNYYTKTECDNKFALKSESGGETINWSNINEDNISMTAGNQMSIRSDGDFELYCEGTFTLTALNEIHTGHYLYCDPADSLYATENYVNTKKNREYRASRAASRPSGTHSVDHEFLILTLF